MKKPISAQKKISTRDLVLTSILSALIIVMTVVPFTGYITVGIIEITTLHIVTILAGVLLGWQGGGFVGTVWGISCIVRCLVAMPQFQPFGFANVFVALIPRTLVGVVSGLVFGSLSNTRLARTPSLMIATVSGTLTNTVLVLTAMTVYCHRHGLEGYEAAGVYSVLSSIVASLAGINGIIEIVTAVVLVPAIYFAIQPRELVLGIDFGGSTTKLALVKGNKCLKTMRKKDSETLDEVLDRFGTAGVKKIAVTGVGASSVQSNIRGIPTYHVEEFAAITAGIRRGAGYVNCVVANIGTGTSFMRISPLFSKHLGGTGMGGGLLKGLSRALCESEEIDQFYKIAEKGDLSHVDIVLADISESTVSNLRPDTTVANLAKLSPDSLKVDVALGLYNMIFQSIGVMAAFAAKDTMARKVLVTGTIAAFPGASDILDSVAALHGITFLIPGNAGFITALGAAMALD